jgi:hypothetical protein
LKLNQAHITGASPIKLGVKPETNCLLFGLSLNVCGGNFCKVLGIEQAGKKIEWY